MVRHLSPPASLNTGRFHACVGLMLLLAPLACSDSTDPEPVPAAIELDPPVISMADGESLRIGARVFDQWGAPLAPLPTGASITWSSSDRAIATVSGGFVTGNRPGAARVTAAVAGASASAMVTVRQVPRGFQRVGGHAQEGVAGEKLHDELVLRVVDRHGTPVPGIALTWEVTAGNGTLAVESDRSDADGLARAAWRLGGVGGRQTVSARSPVIPGIVLVFSATAVGGPDAPFLTSVEPALLQPGETAVITGGNFDLDLPALVVTVAGVPVQTTEVSATRLTVQLPLRSRLPCRPTGDVEIGVTSRGFTAVHSHPLRVGVQRVLSVGSSTVLAGSDDLACSELPAGRYLLSAYNSSQLLGATATVQLRGSTGTSAAAAATADPSPAPATTFRPAHLPLREPADAAVAHLRILDRNREILRTLGPHRRERRAAPSSLARSAVAAPSVGDTLNFRVPRTSAPSGQACSSYDEVRGRVVFAGPRAVIFEDVDAPLSGRMDAVYQSIGEEYEVSMHSVLLENFGDPLALGGELANAEQVYMLFTRAVNDDNSLIAGFVFSGDLFPRSECASSDQAAIFYATVPTASGSGFVPGTAEYWRWTMRSTIIHEVKHITSFAERLSREAEIWEETWLEESTARVSEELWAREVFGYSQRGNVSYSRSLHCEARPDWPECEGSPYVMLKHFSGLYSYLSGAGLSSPLGPAESGDASFYGSGWSLVRWAIDQSTKSEAAFLRELTQETRLSGVGNLEARAGVSFQQMLPRWSLGLASSGIPGHQPQQPGFSFPGWNIADVFASMTSDFPSAFPNPAPQRVDVGATSFERPPFTLRGGASAVFEMQSSPRTRAVQLRGGSGNDPSSAVGFAVLRLN